MCPLHADRPRPPHAKPNTHAGGTLVGYYLDERRGWGLSVEELRRALTEAREEGKLVRGLVFINPGNPTGETERERERTWRGLGRERAGR